MYNLQISSDFSLICSEFNQVRQTGLKNASAERGFRYEGGSFRIDLEFFKKKTFGVITLMAQSSLASLILIDPLNLPSLNSE